MGDFKQEYTKGTMDRKYGCVNGHPSIYVIEFIQSEFFKIIRRIVI